MKNKKIIIILFGIILVFLYISSYFFDNSKANVDAIVEEKIELNEIEESSSKLIKVDIKGFVKNPGVYEVMSSSRVIDIINLAGGLKKNANTEYINLAKLVEDEMIIWVYSNSEIEKFKNSNIKYEYIEKECNCPDVSTSACIDNSNETSKKININTASIEELMTLPGIGESKALNIIEYRKKTPFITIDDIKNVSGIGASAFDKIKDYITV